MLEAKGLHTVDDCISKGIPIIIQSFEPTGLTEFKN